MQIIDILIVAGYFVVILFIGIVISLRRWAKNKGQNRHADDAEFFLAGRSMHWVPVGLSIMVTAFSGINYTAFSGEVFSNGLYVALSLPVFLFVAFPVIRIIMPLYHHMGISSAYEYLEKRFDRRVRALASGLFILWRTFWMATALYVPSKVLATLSGLNLYFLILITGAVVTFYSAGGGIKAVMWTDVAQFVFLIGGLFGVLILAGIQNPEGFLSILSLSAKDGLLKPFYPFDPALFSLDPRIRITIWSSWIGTFVAFMARYGADQMVVQRYFTAKSLKTARTGFHLSYMAAITALLSLALLGFAMHAHAVQTGIMGRLGDSPMPYLTHFFRSLPPGAVGLLVAGLMAATMSSMDSCINSCCAAVVIDFYRPWQRLSRPNAISPDTVFPQAASSVPHAKPGFLSGPVLNTGLTLFFGSIATLTAMSVGQLGTIFEIANKIINGLGSPLLAIFILAMFSRTITSSAVLMGGILGTAWSIWVSFFVTTLALHYYAVVNLIGVLTLCFAGRLLTGGKPSSSQLEWTWKSIKRNLMK